MKTFSTLLDRAVIGFIIFGSVAILTVTAVKIENPKRLESLFFPIWFSNN